MIWKLKFNHLLLNVRIVNITLHSRLITLLHNAFASEFRKKEVTLRKTALNIDMDSF